MSGMKSMTNRHFVRRALLTAAITATATTDTSFALGFENGIEQVDYQPGQPGQMPPQGNTTVTQELNRMFQESGQPMPSMNERDLPNANRPIQGQVQPRTTQTQNHAVPAKPASSPGFMGRLFGKFRGNSGKANANLQPPVPPDYQPETPATASAKGMKYQPGPQHGASPPQTGPAALQPPQAQMTQTHPPQTQGPNRPSQSVHPGQNVSKSATSEAHYGKGRPSAPAEQSSTQFSNGAISPIPPRSGATVHAKNTMPSASGVSGADPAYTQPGSAPGFMPKRGGSAVIQTQPAAVPPLPDEFRNEIVNDNAARPRTGNTRSATVPAPVLGAAAHQPGDGFDSPFSESAESADSSEPLDLDSLIEIPPFVEEVPRTETVTANAVKAIVPQPAIDSESRTATQQPANSIFDPAMAESVESAEESPEENPFTGVQLETSDAELFGDPKVTPANGDNESGAPALPMENFDSNLPAMDLPPVDAAAPATAGETPDTDTVNETTPQETASPTNTSAEIQLPEANVPATMNAAETERLRQTSEQEKRLNQQRLIQARSGQSGFKGFCPVALRERRDLVEANSLFTSTFGLQTYMFASAEAKSAFDLDPSRYAPAAGGCDVVVLVNSGEEQAGQLDYALWYRDRLYLFRSRETMTLFSKDPQRFASQY